MADKKKTQKSGLGRGLGALFSDDITAPESNDISAINDIDNVLNGDTKEKVVSLKIIDVEPNKNQPRKHFDKEKLETLTESVLNHGVVQPILVQANQGGTYTIIAGERRWRAAKAAKLKEIPCIIKDFDEKAVMEIALIENLQREDLNPIDEAGGYKQLMETFGLTQEEVAERVSKSRSAVANSLRLNNLPEIIKDMVRDLRLSQGHARALLSVDDPGNQLKLATRIIEEGLSVRQTEALVNSLSKKVTKNTKPKDTISARYYNDLAKDLTERLGTKVKIIDGVKKGKIEIEYYNKDDLERILFEIRK